LLASNGNLPKHAPVESKAQHRRHHRYSQRNQIVLITVLVLVAVLAIVVGLLWWVNKLPANLH